MHDDTRKLATSILWNALRVVPHGQKINLYELASRCDEFVENDNGEYELRGREDLNDKFWLEEIEIELTERAESEGILLENVGIDDFIPRRIAPRDFEVSDVIELRISRNVWGPPEANTRIVCANGRFEVAQGFVFDKVIASMTAGTHQLDEVADALDFARVSEWKRNYFAPILDGETWKLFLRMRDGSVFVSGGSNNWPDGFWGLWQSLIITILKAPLLEGDYIDNNELCSYLSFAM